MDIHLCMIYYDSEEAKKEWNLDNSNVDSTILFTDAGDDNMI